MNIGYGRLKVLGGVALFAFDLLAAMAEESPILLLIELGEL